MRVLVTGCHGYLGSVMVPRLLGEGFDVLGYDVNYFVDCLIGESPPAIPCIVKDLREAEPVDLQGVDAVIHLAALSNDPMGNLAPQITYDINEIATLRFARMAKEQGVGRFLFSSSCSTYGSAGDSLRTEESDLAPITPYARSKVLVEQGLSELADEHFTTVSLRNATAYGWSPRIRLDLVVNEFAARAIVDGKIVIASDGTPWRPLVHADDICSAFIAMLRAPREAVHNQCFNIGRTSDNFQVRELADAVKAAVPSAETEYLPGGGPDARCYRVECEKVIRQVPGFKLTRHLDEGIAEMCAAFKRLNLSRADLEGNQYIRLRKLRSLQESGKIDEDLRPQLRTRTPSAAPLPA